MRLIMLLSESKERKKNKNRGQKRKLYSDEKSCSWFDIGITACPLFGETKGYCTVLVCLAVIISELKEQQ